MREVYLEQRGSTGDVEHNKSITLVDDGTKVVHHWGSIGAKGQSKVLVESPDPEIRKRVFDAKLKEKTGRKKSPYVLIRTGGVQVEQRPAGAGSDRRFGIEVETHSNLDIRKVADLMRARGLDVTVNAQNYFKSDGARWDIKRDGSCGLEFASPILRNEAGIFDCKLAVEKIHEVCPSPVNSNCGVHVTLDVADHNHADLKRLAIGYLRAQEHFYALCNASRQQNHYCKRNPVGGLQLMVDTPPSSIKGILSMCGGFANHDDRYHGLNWTRVFSLKVVEYRMLESTVSPRVIGAWIKTCVGFVDGLLKSQKVFKSITPFSAETFKKLVNGEEAL